MEKKCFKCKRLLPLSEFYKHPAMGDGHLNKCKDCSRQDAKERAARLMMDEGWVASEKERGRKKYHRLGYREKHKVTFEQKKVIMNTYKARFPEKCAAKSKCSHIHPPEGAHKHHWSYNPEHYKDVLFLSIKDHYTAHRYIIYDQERMMYRNTNGVLLDTKEKHESYVLACIANEIE
jgi:hypothetical protein